MDKIQTQVESIRESRTYIFKLVIEEDSFDDGEIAYHAYCPSLKGARTWGHTIEEAVNNIKEVAKITVESMIERGEQIPEESEIQTSSELLVSVTV